jgi:hypothetical protein
MFMKNVFQMNCLRKDYNNNVNITRSVSRITRHKENEKNGKPANFAEKSSRFRAFGKEYACSRPHKLPWTSREYKINSLILVGTHARSVYLFSVYFATTTQILRKIMYKLFKCLLFGQKVT